MCHLPNNSPSKTSFCSTLHYIQFHCGHSTSQVSFPLRYPKRTQTHPGFDFIVNDKKRLFFCKDFFFTSLPPITTASFEPNAHRIKFLYVFEWPLNFRIGFVYIEEKKKDFFLNSNFFFLHHFFFYRPHIPHPIRIIF